MIRVAGAVYLGYLGWCLLHSDPAKAAGQVQGALGDRPVSDGVGAWKSFQDGFISAATNPKLILWFSAVVSQLVVDEGASQRAAILAGMVLGPVACFSGLSFLGSSIRPWVNATVLKIIDRLAGGLLIALAVIGLALQ
jgi:threonine/homoserine/homoserine lactone efflux protein